MKAAKASFVLWDMMQKGLNRSPNYHNLIYSLSLHPTQTFMPYERNWTDGYWQGLMLELLIVLSAWSLSIVIVQGRSYGANSTRVYITVKVSHSLHMLV